MQRLIARLGLALATGGMLTGLSAVPAWASAGSRTFSGDQVGYAATGAAFSGSEIQIKLPDAAKYASEVGRIGISLQLWAKHTVVDFTAFACTDKACRPGGRPETFRYRLDISVYDRATGALRCSTTAVAARQRCFDAFPSWNRARIAPGTTELLDLQYSQGLMLASANALNAAVPVTVGAISQARIVIQFGPTPFSIAPFHRPHEKRLFMTVGTFASEFIFANGRGAYIGSPLLVRHKVDMTSTGRDGGRAESAPTDVFDHGAFFRIYFL